MSQLTEMLAHLFTQMPGSEERLDKFVDAAALWCVRKPTAVTMVVVVDVFHPDAAPAFGMVGVGLALAGDQCDAVWPIEFGDREDLNRTVADDLDGALRRLIPSAEDQP